MNRKQHPVLDWLISDEAGIVTVQPVEGKDYANGSAHGHQLCFHNEEDTIRQLHGLINCLARRAYEKHPEICDPKFGGCGKPLPFDRNSDWECPACGTHNMGA